MGVLTFLPRYVESMGALPATVALPTSGRSGVAFVQVSGVIPPPPHEDAPSHITYNEDLRGVPDER
jgi:hypothetical protein